MLTLVTLASVLLSGNGEVLERSEGLAPTVFISESMFSKPLERTGKITIPNSGKELAWGVLKQAKRPEDILMESPYTQKQTDELLHLADNMEVGF